MQCFHCHSDQLRLSRLQFFDVPRLLKLQFPVRCRSCRDRSYVTLPFAWKLRTAAKAAQNQTQDRKKINGGTATI